MEGLLFSCPGATKERFGLTFQKKCQPSSLILEVLVQSKIVVPPAFASASQMGNTGQGKFKPHGMILYLGARKT